MTNSPVLTNNVKILAWNAEGIDEKLSYDDIHDLVQNHDIILISETWREANCVNDSNQLQFTDYTCIDMPRQYKHNNAC